ncbi:MAG: NTP transferase domain-containing protein [Candidatus Puniceispirillaceae bacterium]
MKFGERDIEHCLGAVLAHSQKLGTRRIAKGTRLETELIDAFRAQGVDALVCAMPEAGDLDENIAAREIALQLAKKVAATSIEMSEAATGRVNFKAREAGILRYDRQDLLAFNLVHEGVGLSLPVHNQLLKPGQIAATLKIIPYFLHGDIVQTLLKQVQSRPIFTFHPIAPKKGYLIQTRGAALPEKVYEATRAVTRNRLHDLGCGLIDAAVCAHIKDALKDELQAARQAGAELVLICGGSAIADKQDVVPVAIEELGGQINQLGLAVDPGNMLMVAEWQGMPIIGMPGCARSPKLNGFDWVLHLLLAGIELSRRELADLAAGGLLGEIAARPMPRSRAVKAPSIPALPQKMACILLAAGQSRRMGDTNKLLMEIQSKPVIRHAAEALIAAGIGDIYVVTGYQAEAVRDCLAGLDIHFIDNPDYATGQAGSVACGVAHLPDQVSDVLIALGDMPLMQADMLTALYQQHMQKSASGLPQITLPTYTPLQEADTVKRGNPVIWSRAFFSELTVLEGDQGGRQILADYPAHIQHLHWPDARPFADVDTAAAFAQARQHIMDR